MKQFTLIIKGFDDNITTKIIRAVRYEDKDGHLTFYNDISGDEVIYYVQSEFVHSFEVD